MWITIARILFIRIFPVVTAFVFDVRHFNGNTRYFDAEFHPSSVLTTTTLRMGRKVTIRIVGRKQGGEEWLEDACDMYLQRLKPTGFEVNTEWYKNNDALMKVHNEQSSQTLKYVPMVLLDPTGLRCTSETFTDKMYDWLQEGGSRLVFVIGGGKDS